MKIKILPSASQDLIDGYWFYEKQSPGLGVNRVNRDSDRLKILLKRDSAKNRRAD